MTNGFSYVNLLLEMQKYKFLFPSDDEIFGRFKVSMVKVVPFKVMGFFNLMQMFYLLLFFYCFNVSTYVSYFLEILL